MDTATEARRRGVDMSKKEVPAKKIFTCDCCGESVETPPNKSRPDRWSRLCFYRDAEDWQGNAVASANVEMDLCSKCSLLISGAINKAQEDLHKAAA